MERCNAIEIDGERKTNPGMDCGRYCLWNLLANRLTATSALPLLTLLLDQQALCMCPPHLPPRNPLRLQVLCVSHKGTFEPLGQ
jgi:hypothetical protein